MKLHFQRTRAKPAGVSRKTPGRICPGEVPNSRQVEIPTVLCCELADLREQRFPKQGCSSKPPIEDDPQVNRGVVVAGILVLTGLAVWLAYWLCFAAWMTAYYSPDPGLLRAWQVRFYMLLVTLLMVCAADLYLVIKAIRIRNDHNVTG